MRIVHFRLVVCVASGAGILGIIIRIGMAFTAFCPLHVMLAGINRELAVVQFILGRRPARIGGMAIPAGNRKVGAPVIRVGGRVVIGQMTG